MISKYKIHHGLHQTIGTKFSVNTALDIRKLFVSFSRLRKETKRTTLKLKMTTMVFLYHMATCQMTKEYKIVKKRTKMTVMNGKL